MLENGLIQFELTSDSAYEHTLINGKPLPQETKTQILNHMDKIYFGSTAMLLFKYPLLSKKQQQLREQIQQDMQEAEEQTNLEEDEMQVLVQSRLTQNGLTDDIDNVVCEEYTEEEIENDLTAIDWEQAYEEIQQVENEKRQRQLELI